MVLSCERGIGDKDVWSKRVGSLRPQAKVCASKTVHEEVEGDERRDGVPHVRHER